jgi:preprotein translocase subunit SecY
MTPELTRRVALTFGALLVYRFGTFIPLPGIAPSVWEQIFRLQADSTLGMANLLSGMVTRLTMSVRSIWRWSIWRRRS